MNLRILSLSALCLAASTFVRAEITLTVNSNGGPVYATSAGTFLTPGSIIRVGEFNTSGANLATLQTSNDFATVNSLFTAFAENNAGGGSIVQNGNTTVDDILVNNGTPGNQSGNVIGDIQHILATYCTTGSQLYVWVFNGPDYNTATEWGIFTSSSPVWTFPADLSQRTLSTFQVDTIIRGSTTGGTTTGDQLRLASVATVVPEPSSLLLLLSCGFIARRRRR
jgi:hypothetical protein